MISNLLASISKGATCALRRAEDNLNEFDLYCHNKSTDVRRRLEQVRSLIQACAPEVAEGRIHFYLVYHLGGGPLVKLHLDTKEQPIMTFPVGSELHDPAKLLKGTSLSRTIKFTSDAYLTKHRDAISDLLTQALTIVKQRWDGSTAMITLRPDQPSP